MTSKNNSKRQQNTSTFAKASFGNRWTESHQQRLEKLLEEGTLNLSDTAKQVKGADDCFSNFSNAVVGYHLGQMKKKKVGSSTSRPVNDVLKQFGVTPSARSEMSQSDSIDLTMSDSATVVDSLVCENMPFVRFNYMDYESKQEKIVVLMDLPGGSGNYDWEFNPMGDAITLHVNWSRALYDVSNLFKIELQMGQLTLDHPKLHSLQTELIRNGIGLNQIPKCSIQVPLGKRVQKDDDTWDIHIFQHEGNKILMIEFSCFQEEVLKRIKRGHF